MRKKPQAFVFLVFFLGLMRGICAQDAQPAASKPVIIIEDLGGNKAEVPGWQPALGQGISEMLIESLEGSDGKFQVLEAAESTSSQNEPKSDASNSAGGGTKSASGSAGSKKPANGGAANSEKTHADDTIGSEKSDTGGSADSDFTFCGEVTQFTMQTNSSKLGDFVSSSAFANLGARVSTAHIEIEWRIVDSETKKILKRGITVSSASGSEFDMAALAATDGNASGASAVGSAAAHAKPPVEGQGGANNYMASANNFFNGLNKAFGNTPSEGGGGGSAKTNGGTTAKSPKAPTKAGGDVAESDSAPIGYGDPEFMKSALGRASCKAITNIIEQLVAISFPESGRITKLKTATDSLKHTPGKVLAVAGKDAIIVSLGSKEGFKEGDELELYQPTDVKDDKGNVVFTDEKLVGEITLQSVQDEKSRASYSGDAQVQQGWTVKAK
ncbi:MAG TPA: hypothetical protein VHX90_03055 [Verrucomicrobiae bacterium]|jgi:curli biogenesis system outer membrane secretion channel CsgG|nr:hypothetical protein [Verrucomicrobiae bacterium]